MTVPYIQIFIEYAEETRDRTSKIDYISAPVAHISGTFKIIYNYNNIKISHIKPLE